MDGLDFGDELAVARRDYDPFAGPGGLLPVCLNDGRRSAVSGIRQSSSADTLFVQVDAIAAIADWPVGLRLGVENDQESFSRDRRGVAGCHVAVTGIGLGVVARR